MVGSIALEAVALILEKYEAAGAMLHGFDHSAWWDGSPGGRLALLPGGQDHILAQEDGKARFTKLVRELSQAFTL